MKIGISEIWNLACLIDMHEHGWHFDLVAGDVCIRGLSLQELTAVWHDSAYDVELLPALFTFREILWQPDVFTESANALPALRILKAHCEEVTEAYEHEQARTPLHLYTRLLEGVAAATGLAIQELHSQQSVREALRALRLRIFPIIRFFICHPQNKTEYQRDAINRLNFAVKVMITEFDGKYTEFTDPYWEVHYQPSEKSED